MHFMNNKFQRRKKDSKRDGIDSKKKIQNSKTGLRLFAFSQSTSNLKTYEKLMDLATKINRTKGQLVALKILNFM